MRLLDRRIGYVVIATTLVLATAFSALASAAQVTQRSVEISSSSVEATNVAYTVNFTAPTAAGAVVIDFCSNSPLLGQACAAPVGFNVGAAATSGGFTKGTLTTPADNTVMVTGSVTGATAIPLTGVTNPDTAGPLYARIVTYTDSTGAADYTALNPDVAAAHLDDGGVALYITPTVGVSGAVLETMTFCVSKDLIGQTCAGATTPVLELGEPTGGVRALNTDAVSADVIHTQLSTNAAGGAIISLKSANDCGGMKRLGAAVCDIEPALVGDIAEGQAKFGVKTADATDTVGYAEASGELIPMSGYNNLTFVLNYLATNASGVTSTFGDPFLSTNSKPVNNKNVALTFGASINNDTPAGIYSTDLSLIATGKF